VSDGDEILRDERALKEGRGPTNKSFKAEVKGMIKKATKKLIPGKSNEEDNPPAPVAPEAAAPLTQKQKLAMKYSSSSNKYEDGADVLPATSKFANTSTSTSSNKGRNYDDQLLPPTSRFSKNDDLLPSTSRFSKNAAILDVNMSNDDSSSKSFAKNTQMTSASGTTQKPKFGLFGKSNKNDEVGLLGFSSKRSDSSLV